MNKTEAERFEENYSKLNESLKNFVDDFKKWPKADQEKIKLWSNSGGFSFSVDGKLLSADKFDGNIAYWLHNQLKKDQTIPFFLALDYLKKAGKK